MRRFTVIACLMMLSMALPLASIAQGSSAASAGAEAAKTTETPAHFYKLEIVVEQLGADGKPVNSRSYSTIVSTLSKDRNAEIRTGSRVPFLTAKKEGNSEWQYQDIGVNLDAQFAREVGSMLTFSMSATVSSIAATTGAPQELDSLPTLNDNKWQGQVVVPVGKATVVCRSDDTRGKGSMQILVTATLIQ